MWQSFVRLDQKGADVVLYLSSFVIGLALAPWSNGFLYFLVFIILFELLSIYMTGMQPEYWNVWIRLGMIGATFLGFVLGRSLIGDPEPIKITRRERRKILHQLHMK